MPCLRLAGQPPGQSDSAAAQNLAARPLGVSYQSMPP